MGSEKEQDALDRLRDMGYAVATGCGQPPRGVRHVVMPDGGEYWVSIYVKDGGFSAQVEDARFEDGPVVAWGTGGGTLDDVIGRVTWHLCGGLPRVTTTNARRMQ